jgi:hypothetical protein
MANSIQKKATGHRPGSGTIGNGSNQEENIFLAKFGVPTAVLLKIQVFRDDMTCQVVNTSQYGVRAQNTWILMDHKVSSVER